MLHADQKVIGLHPNSCSYGNSSFSFIFVESCLSALMWGGRTLWPKYARCLRGENFWWLWWCEVGLICGRSVNIKDKTFRGCCWRIFCTSTSKTAQTLGEIWWLGASTVQQSVFILVIEKLSFVAEEQIGLWMQIWGDKEQTLLSCCITDLI